MRALIMAAAALLLPAAAAGAPGGGVVKLVAGANITLNPTSGYGTVTITGTGGTGSTSNTALSSFTVLGSILSTDTVTAGTMTIAQNGVNILPFSNSPLSMAGNTNTFFQVNLQNQSNGTNASADYIVTGDLGGNTSFYMDVGMNSSRFSVAAQSAQISSSGYVYSSDSDMLVWADSNGGRNGGSGKLIFGSSLTVSGNYAMMILPATDAGPGALVVLSSQTIKGGGGLLLTYGLSASSGSFTSGVTASSFTASGTNGTVQAAWLAAANSSTMTVTGSFTMISSNTITGSTSTVGTALTSFSSYTVRANDYAVGDTMRIICVFKDDLLVTPTTPVSGVYFGATVLAAAAFSNFAQNMQVEAEINFVQTGRAMVTGKAQVQSAGQTALVSVTSGAGIQQIALDHTVANTFNCKASRAGGGTIGFIFMKVKKE